MLSKSEFVRGLDCERRLWLDRHQTDLKRPVSPAERERIETGGAIGKLAQKRFPEGVTAPADLRDKLVAATRTRELVDSDATCIFEGTFLYEDLVTRIDILSRGHDGWTIYEVKSSAAKEPDQIDEGRVFDLAFQVYVLTGAGIPVVAAKLILVDTSYVWPGHSHEPDLMLREVDITARCIETQTRVKKRSMELFETLVTKHPPEVEINTHCKKCDYFQFCLEGRPHDIIHLPRISTKSVRELRLLGYDNISDIPESHKLSDPRKLLRDVLRSGIPYVADGLAEALSTVRYPAAFIDYETSNPAFPAYAGTKPYQQVCFQWSAHVVDSEAATPSHFEFLAADASDPRPEFCKSLWDVINSAGSVVYYTNFELAQMKAMERDGIPYASRLVALFEERRVDLEKILSEHVCFPEFIGQTSLKVVLPFLVPHMSYRDMQIRDGNAAAWAFRRMLSTTDENERFELRAGLLAYCRQDTLAMVHIHKALSSLS